ncbi:unnamed protein product [Brassica oleracea]
MISTKLATFSVYEAQTTKGGDSNTYRGLANQSRNHHNTVSRLQRKLNHHRSRQSLPADDRGQQRKSKPETETKRGEHEKTGEAKSKRG